MTTLLTVAAIKGAVALVLALVAALVARTLRARPGVVHALWLLVLCELLVPPVIVVGVLPAPGAAITRLVAPTTSRPPAPVVATEPTLHLRATATRASWPWQKLDATTLGGLLWLGGGAAVLLLAGVRLHRFRRLLGAAEEGPDWLTEDVARLAARFELRRPPRLRLVPSRISPAVRHLPGRYELLFPAGLLGRLTRAERDALLLHELAHVARRDPWVRYVELAAVALFWWHPAVWWARTHLRRAEERCCDGLVVRTCPGSATDYARGLLKTVEFLGGHGATLPALACGLGEFRNLEERLTMIVKREIPPVLSPRWRSLLVLTALLALLVFPTWAQRETEDATDDAAVRQELRELEQHAARLAAELARVRERQMELQHGALIESRQAELDRLREEIAQHEADGDREDAALEREFALQEEKLARERERAGRDRHLAKSEQQRLEREFALQEESLARERERAERDQHLAKSEQQRLEREFALQEESLARERENAERDRHLAQKEQQQAEHAEQLLEERMAVLESQLTERRRAVEELGRQLDAQIEALEQVLQDRRSRGEDALPELERQLDELRRLRDAQQVY